MRTIAAVACALSCALILQSPARAFDPFEIQVYDGTANAPGVPGLELHVNRVMSGVRSAEPPLLPQDGQSHFTLEPSLGVAPFCELGAYLQSALLPSGEFAYAGFKLRSKFVTPPDWHPHLRLGLNIELAFVPDRFDNTSPGSELRPIVAWESRDVLLAINPIVEIGLARPGWSEGPAFAPAAMALYKWREKIAVGLEYYAELGSITHGFAPVSAQEHYLFEVFNWIGTRRLELNLGVGEGLTGASNAWTIKMIAGYAWEPSPASQITH
jgi:hypothetical protein